MIGFVVSLISDFLDSSVLDLLSSVVSSGFFLDVIVLPSFCFLFCLMISCFFRGIVGFDNFSLSGLGFKVSIGGLLILDSGVLIFSSGIMSSFLDSVLVVSSEGYISSKLFISSCFNTFFCSDVLTTEEGFMSGLLLLEGGLMIKK